MLPCCASAGPIADLSTPPPPRSAPHDGEGIAEGYRQGSVLSVERNPVSCNAAVNLWIRNSHDSIVQSAPEQVRPVYGEQAVVWRSPESQDLEVLKNVDKGVPSSRGVASSRLLNVVPLKTLFT